VNTLEDRLRDAYCAAAETVHPETVLPGGVRGLHGDGHPPARPGRRGRSRSPLLVPLAAAVAVTAVVGTVYVLGSHLFARHGGRRPATAASPATPAFFVALNWTTDPSAFVVNAVTGAQGARIRLPFPARYFVAVATGDGRTFVAAEAKPRSCQTALYRFVLAADGTPTTLTRFATVPGLVSSPWDMAVLGNGRTIVYDTTGCGQPRPREVLRGYLAMVNIATGQAERWTFTEGAAIGRSLPLCYGDTSLSASERTIGFCDRVVPTSAAPGPLALRGRIIAHNGEFGRTTIIGGMDVAPDGKTAYFTTFRVQHHKPAGRNWQLRAIDLATGQTSLIHSFPGTQGTEAAVTPDPTGRYLLVEYDPHAGGTRLARLNLKTGRLTQLSAGWAIEAAIAW
jgi:hypothetical protein